MMRKFVILFPNNLSNGFTYIYDDVYGSTDKCLYDAYASTIPFTGKFILYLFLFFAHTYVRHCIIYFVSVIKSGLLHFMVSEKRTRTDLTLDLTFGNLRSNLNFYKDKFI